MAENVKNLENFVHEAAEKSANMTAKILRNLGQKLTNDASDNSKPGIETAVLVIIGLVCTQVF